MYDLGDLYGIHRLKTIASGIIRRYSQAASEWYADGRPPTSVSELWVQAIKCTYDSTPRSDKGLRDQVLRYARPHLK